MSLLRRLTQIFVPLRPPIVARRRKRATPYFMRLSPVPHCPPQNEGVLISRGSAVDVRIMAGMGKREIPLGRLLRLV